MIEPEALVSQLGKLPFYFPFSKIFRKISPIQ